MLGLGASARKLRERFDARRDNGDALFPAGGESAALIAHALYRREMNGVTTTLRQVHHLVDIGQPEALRIIKDFEGRGLILIEQDINDELESKVALSEALRQRLTQILQHDKS